MKPFFKYIKKQKESHIKNDWFAMLLKDFEFIGEELEDTIISQYSKNQYKNIIKSKVRKAAFELYNNSKKSKICEIKYTTLETQSYLKHFNKNEVKILSQLRSKCYLAKANFPKLYANNMNCIFCHKLDTQTHIFEDCHPVISEMIIPRRIKLNKIYGNFEDQSSVIHTIIEIDEIRTKLKTKSHLGD